MGGSIQERMELHIVLWEMPKYQLEVWVARAVIRGMRRRQFIRGVSHKFKGATGGFKPACKGALWPR